MKDLKKHAMELVDLLLDRRGDGLQFVLVLVDPLDRSEDGANLVVGSSLPPEYSPELLSMAIEHMAHRYGPPKRMS